jgi:hypothetical protein
MESKDLVYKYGHFYDKTTGKRLGLKEGALFCIQASKNDFVSFSGVGKLPKKIFDSHEKELLLKNEPNLASYKKICSQGSFLYFSISRFGNPMNINHEFQVKLLEDLYVYLKRDWKRQEDRLFDCARTVVADISETIEFFEEINAKSLNEAYKNTFVHFFENKGNPACTALDRFYEKPGCDNLTIAKKRIVIN